MKQYRFVKPDKKEKRKEKRKEKVVLEINHVTRKKV